MIVVIGALIAGFVALVGLGFGVMPSYTETQLESLPLIENVETTVWVARFMCVSILIGIVATWIDFDLASVPLVLNKSQTLWATGRIVFFVFVCIFGILVYEESKVLDWVGDMRNLVCSVFIMIGAGLGLVTIYRVR